MPTTRASLEAELISLSGKDRAARLLEMADAFDRIEAMALDLAAAAAAVRGAPREARCPSSPAR